MLIAIPAFYGNGKCGVCGVCGVRSVCVVWCAVCVCGVLCACAVCAVCCVCGVYFFTFFPRIFGASLLFRSIGISYDSTIRGMTQNSWHTYKECVIITCVTDRQTGEIINSWYE
jgi:hypothetical protein